MKHFLKKLLLFQSSRSIGTRPRRNFLRALIFRLPPKRVKSSSIDRKLLTLVNHDSISLHHAVYYLEHLVSQGSVVDQCMIVGISTPLLPVRNAKFFSNVNDEQLDHVYIILKVFSEVCNKQMINDTSSCEGGNWKTEKCPKFARTYRVYHSTIA